MAPQRPSPTQSDCTSLPDAIRWMGQHYINSGRAVSLCQINNGLCDAFARDVIDLMGGETSSLFEMDAGNLSVNGEDDEWDQELLRKYWPACRPTHGVTWQQANEYGLPRHVWIVYNNRHYDAECPQGVDNIFALPLVRRAMQRIAADPPPLVAPPA